jgi:hypothetical protein
MEVSHKTKLYKTNYDIFLWIDGASGEELKALLIKLFEAESLSDDELDNSRAKLGDKQPVEGCLNMTLYNIYYAEYTRRRGNSSLVSLKDVTIHTLSRLRYRLSE